MEKFKKHWLVILLVFIILVGLFYWFEWRPAKIKHDCSWVERHIDAQPAYPGLSQAEKENAKKEQLAQIAKCDGSSICWAKYVSNIAIDDGPQPAQPAKDWWEKASPAEYTFCIHEKGL